MLSRLRFVLLIFAIAGVVMLFVSEKRYPEKTEKWMESAIPTQLPGYQAMGSSLEGNKMDPVTYSVLKPFGIVIRLFEDDAGRVFDFTVIAGNTRESFHDPQICFSAQRWALINPRKREVNIPALGGPIAATVMAIEQPGKRGIALYFYKDPMGWRHSPLYVPFDLTAAKLMLKNYSDAQFFRFILSPSTMPEDQSPEAVEAAMQKDIALIGKFANAMFSALDKTPDGRYFVVNP